MSTFNEIIEKAFDYRGDVTVRLKDGSSLVGFIFNREFKGNSRCPEPFIELMFADTPATRRVPCRDIASVEFTGEDTAAGKSWEEWTAKEAARKQHSATGA